MPCPCSTSSQLVYISTEPVLKCKRQSVVVLPRKVVVSTNPAKTVSTVPVAVVAQRAAPVAVAAVRNVEQVVAAPAAAVQVQAERVEAVAVAANNEKTVVVANPPVARQTVTYELACPCSTPKTFVKNVETVVNRHHYHTVRVVDNTNNYNTYVTNNITKVNDIHHQRVEHVQGETRVINDARETTTVEPAKCQRVVDGKTVDC